MSFRVNHSNNAIVKPPEMTPQAAAKELESVMKRVREAQCTIAAAIDPGTTSWCSACLRDLVTDKWNCPDTETATFPPADLKKRSPSRSQRLCRSRSRSRSRSKMHRKRSRSKQRWWLIHTCMMLWSYVGNCFRSVTFFCPVADQRQSCVPRMTPTILGAATGGALSPETRNIVAVALWDLGILGMLGKNHNV